MERLGQKLKAGELKDIVAIPTSIRTKEQAESLGIPLVTLDSHSGARYVLIGLMCAYIYILMRVLGRVPRGVPRRSTAFSQYDAELTTTKMRDSAGRGDRRRRRGGPRPQPGQGTCCAVLC